MADLSATTVTLVTNSGNWRSLVSSRDVQLPAHRRLSVRRRALRGHRAARVRRLLPLHALPAADGNGGLGAGTHRARLAAHRRRRGARARLRAAGRVREALLLRLRLVALEPEPGGSRGDEHPPGRLRPRP